MEIENPESVKKAVQNGLGIAFISAFAAETDLKARTLVAIEIRNLKIRRELKIVLCLCVLFFLFFCVNKTRAAFTNVNAAAPNSGGDVSK